MRLTMIQRVTWPMLIRIGLTLACCWAALFALPANAWQADSPVPKQSSRRSPTKKKPVTEERAKPKQAIQLDVHAASFKNITPGKTTLAEVKTALGQPIDENRQGDETVWSYRLDPFPKVEVALQKNVTTSIIIYLDEPTAPRMIAKELELQEFHPVAILDEKGQPLGEVYPERGITFAFAEEKPVRVAQILLETISAEPFVLRAQQDTGHHYQRNLADLNYAAKLDPDDANIYSLRAEILASIGRVSEALDSARRAARLQADSSAYQLAQARLLASLGQFEQAGQLAKKLLIEGTETIWQAHAELLLGDLSADGPSHAYNEAIQHHMAAIEKAIPLATDKNDEVRRKAKRLLIDAHLAVASDIAWGKWKSKTTVAPQWLNRAVALVAESIQNEEGTATLKILLHRKTLSVMTGMGGKLDPSATAKSMQEEGSKLIAAADDPLYRRQLEWQLGEALLDAARIERTRGNAEQSLKHANDALTLFRQSTERDEPTPAGDRLLGETYYFIGSHHAIVAKKHDEAIAWYEKAVTHYNRPLPESALIQQGRRGEQLVSMGVSFWQAKKHEQGLSMTRGGVRMLEQAIAGGAIPPNTLIIPYGNLASMYRQTGNDDEAKRLANLASQLEKAGDTPQRR